MKNQPNPNSKFANTKTVKQVSLMKTCSINTATRPKGLPDRSGTDRRLNSSSETVDHNKAFEHPLGPKFLKLNHSSRVYPLDFRGEISWSTKAEKGTRGCWRWVQEGEPDPCTSVDDLNRFYTGSDIMDIPRVLYKSFTPPPQNKRAMIYSKLVSYCTLFTYKPQNLSTPFWAGKKYYIINDHFRKGYIVLCRIDFW